MFLTSEDNFYSCCHFTAPVIFPDDAKQLRIKLVTETRKSELDPFFAWTLDNKLPLKLDRRAQFTTKADCQPLFFDNDHVENRLLEKALELVEQGDFEWNHQIGKTFCQGIQDNIHDQAQCCKSFIPVEDRYTQKQEFSHSSLFQLLFLTYGVPLQTTRRILEKD